MKSALELALERSGGAVRQLDAETKAAIADIEGKYQARIVALELGAEERIRAATEPEEAKRIQDGIVAEITALRERCELEKTKARQ